MELTKIIIAESSDIMLNGIEDLLAPYDNIKIVGRALRYNHLCMLVESTQHDLVVLGPMITEKFSHQLTGYLMNRFPGIKLAQIHLDDNSDLIARKIEKACVGMEV